MIQRSAKHLSLVTLAVLFSICSSTLLGDYAYRLKFSPSYSLAIGRPAQVDDGTSTYKNYSGPSFRISYQLLESNRFTIEISYAHLGKFNNLWNTTASGPINGNLGSPWSGIIEESIQAFTLSFNYRVMSFSRKNLEVGPAIGFYKNHLAFKGYEENIYDFIPGLDVVWVKKTAKRVKLLGEYHLLFLPNKTIHQIGVSLRVGVR